MSDPRIVNLDLTISDSAARKVRMGFNPSTLPGVDAIHTLSAALITLLESHIKDVPLDAPGRDLMKIHERNRHIALAITHVETASMFGVKAATTDVYFESSVK